MKAFAPPRAVRLGLFTLSAALLGALSVVPACGNGNQPPPSTTSTGTTGPSTSASSTGSGGATTSSSSSAGTGGTSSSSSGTGGADAGPPCVNDGGTTGCFSCPPQTNDQFLNACAPSGDQCTHFDNAAKLPFWDGGALPAAP